MSGIVETAPGSGEAAPSVAAESVPNRGGIQDAAPGSDPSFLIPESVMDSPDLDEVEIPAAGAAGTAPEAPATTTAKPEASTKPAVPAAGEKPTPEKPAEVKPEVKPATTAETPPKPVAQTAPVDSRPNLLAEVAKNRDAIIAHLADSRFKLSKEESDLLDVDANAGIQKIAARVYYEATTSTLNLLDRFVKQELPQLLEQHVQSTQTYRAAEDDFYKEWPNLDRASDEKTVNQYANIYRQANPTATKADAIKAVGTIVSAILNKPKASVAATAPAKPNGPKPFTPASGAARVVSTQQVPAADPFAGLGREFE
jgi:hypothetical protein